MVNIGAPCLSNSIDFDCKGIALQRAFKGSYHTPLQSPQGGYRATEDRALLESVGY